MPRIRMESGPRGVDHITIPHEKMRESGWQIGDEVTFNWDGKRMILTKLPKQVAVSKTPAEVEIPTVEKSVQESPDKAINITAAPPTKERPGHHGAFTAQGYRACPTCNVRVSDFQFRCHACGAELS